MGGSRPSGRPRVGLPPFSNAGPLLLVDRARSGGPEVAGQRRPRFTDFTGHSPPAGGNIQKDFTVGFRDAGACQTFTFFGAPQIFFCSRSRHFLSPRQPTTGGYASRGLARKALSTFAHCIG